MQILVLQITDAEFSAIKLGVAGQVGSLESNFILYKVQVQLILN
jgi:hypothetical protein